MYYSIAREQEAAHGEMDRARISGDSAQVSYYNAIFFASLPLRLSTDATADKLLPAAAA